MKYLIAILVVALGFYYAWPLIIGPSRVIEDVTAFSENDTVVVQVNFAVPVRYENHFPERNGEFLQIKLRLVSLGKTQWRESLGLSKVRPELAKQLGLVNVAFEGDVEGGPMITFLFNRPAEFQLRQDTGMNTLMVVFPAPLREPGAPS